VAKSAVAPSTTFAHNLMARNELLSKWREISFHNVQISAANPAGDNPKQDVPGLKLWTGDFLDLKKTIQAVYVPM
jgi:hypothetical protein